MRYALAISSILLLGGNGPKTAIEPGRYELVTRTEMPHLERYARTRVATVCIRAVPIPVISGNGAFEGCALEDLRRDGRHLRYSLICAGVSGARAFARYRQTRDGFSGRIFIKLGAKNMTLTEVQKGRRLGFCD